MNFSRRKRTRFKCFESHCYMNENNFSTQFQKSSRHFDEVTMIRVNTLHRSFHLNFPSEITFEVPFHQRNRSRKTTGVAILFAIVFMNSKLNL